MNSDNQKLRSEIQTADKWNIDAMYSDSSAVLEDVSKGMSHAQHLASMQGHVMDSPASLLDALISYTEAYRAIENAYAYAHMKRDEDNTDTAGAELFGKVSMSLTALTSLTAFLDPEILAADPSLVRSYMDEEEGLGMYRFLLTELLKQRDHTLSKEEEFIIASYGEVFRSSGNIFTALNNADMEFGTVTDEDGNAKPLTHGTFVRFLESQSETVRKEAYDKLYDKYISLNNTLTAVYSNSVRKDAVTAKLRHYSSSLDAALTSNDIPLSVYDSLIHAVHEHLPSMHRYAGIRRRMLGLETMGMHDMYVPLVRPQEAHYTYEQAAEICCKALAPMGEEYVNAFRKGVLEKRWVDRYENKGKTSGAYSYGSYDSEPYILMNFSGTLRDIFTLIHEGGHSMHSWYTRQTQPFIYGDHSIFTAEVASTVNETLLIHYLMDHAENDEMLLYLVNFYIDEFKGTLFRQTMFAEFEKLTHEYIESGGSLTPEWLNTEYGRLNSEYYGPEVTYDDKIKYEWSRIPHFYRAFYVYQYATGYSAANAIAERILTEGPSARDEYISFLRSGSSGTPIDLLKLAGVDMSTEKPVRMALEVFDGLVGRLDELTKGNRNA
ncbi:MAG: oligoendopeptidase F [Mogibacterium sp.]|nr:oligoendopeptidase F [Mogibacterium sp.]